ncbi:MAG: HemK/PrmC family methyltransferase, partial [Nitrospinota bacterium]
ISLASEIPSLHCIAVDISAGALETARFNSKTLNLEGRISFLRADLRDLPFSNLENGGLFDIIVSNPPYIRSADIGSLMPEVALFEPRLALDGGADGLVSYRQIIEGCQAILRPEGVLIMETGMGQAGDIIGFINSLAIFGEAEIINDLAGIERVVAVKRLPA